MPPDKRRNYLGRHRKQAAAAGQQLPPQAPGMDRAQPQAAGMDTSPEQQWSNYVTNHDYLEKSTNRSHEEILDTLGMSTLHSAVYSAAEGMSARAAAYNSNPLEYTDAQLIHQRMHMMNEIKPAEEEQQGDDEKKKKKKPQRKSQKQLEKEEAAHPMNVGLFVAAPSDQEKIGGLSRLPADRPKTKNSRINKIFSSIEKYQHHASLKFVFDEKMAGFYEKDRATNTGTNVERIMDRGVGPAIEMLKELGAEIAKSFSKDNKILRQMGLTDYFNTTEREISAVLKQLSATSDHISSILSEDMPTKSQYSVDDYLRLDVVKSQKSAQESYARQMRFYNEEMERIERLRLEDPEKAKSYILPKMPVLQGAGI